MTCGRDHFSQSACPLSHPSLLKPYHLLCSSPVQFLALCEQMSKVGDPRAVSIRGVSLGHTRGENQPLETGKPLGHLAKGLAELEGTVLSLGTTLWFRDMAAAVSAAGELLRAPRSSSLAQTALSLSPSWYIQGHCLQSRLHHNLPFLELLQHS